MLLLLLLSTALAADPCLDPADVDASIPFDQRLESEHVALAWNDLDAPDEPQAFLDAMEAARSAYVEQGFVAPDAVLVVAKTLPGGTTGGYTQLLDCGDTTEAAIVVHAPRLDGSSSMRSLAAHEYFHAVQAEYVDAYEDVTDPWIIEASAVFASWQAFPDDTEEPLRHAERWAERPWADWEDLDYGAWVVLGHLDEFEPGFHVELWETVRDFPDWSAREGIDWWRGSEGAADFLRRMPSLSLGEVAMPRPEDHGGLDFDGGVGEPFQLGVTGAGTAVARVDLSGVVGAVQFEVDETRVVMTIAVRGEEVTTRLDEGGSILSAAEEWDVAYVVVAREEPYDDEWSIRVDVSTRQRADDPCADEPGDWCAEERVELREGCGCNNSGAGSLLLLPLLLIRRKIHRDPP